MVRFNVQTQEPVRIVNDEVLRLNPDLRFYQHTSLVPGWIPVENFVGRGRGMRIWSIHAELNTPTGDAEGGLMISRLVNGANIMVLNMTFPTWVGAITWLEYYLGATTVQTFYRETGGVDSWTVALPDLVMDDSYYLMFDSNGCTSTVFNMFYEIFNL